MTRPQILYPSANPAPPPSSFPFNAATNSSSTRLPPATNQTPSPATRPADAPMPDQQSDYAGALLALAMVLGIFTFFIAFFLMMVKRHRRVGAPGGTAGHEGGSPGGGALFAVGRAREAVPGGLDLKLIRSLPQEIFDAEAGGLKDLSGKLPQTVPPAQPLGNSVPNPSRDSSHWGSTAALEALEEEQALDGRESEVRGPTQVCTALTEHFHSEGEALEAGESEGSQLPASSLPGGLLSASHCTIPVPESPSASFRSRTIPALESPSASLRSRTSSLGRLPAEDIDDLSASKAIACGTYLKECTVCLQEYKTGDAISWLPACKHAFHSGCIEAWLLARGTCPLCRVRVVSSVA